MKYLIPLTFMFALAGCEQAADSGAPDQDTATASANVAEKAWPQGSSAAPDKTPAAESELETGAVDA